MDLPHYLGLMAGYAAAMLLWFAISRLLPGIWPPREDVAFARPWCEFGWALVAALLLLGIGQAYQRGWLLPETGGDLEVADFLNQILIFAPMPALLLIRRQSLATAWLPLSRLPARIGIGLLLALTGLVSFSLFRDGLTGFPALLGLVYQTDHLHLALHVFLEDLTIAILFVRLSAALRRTGTVALVVATLFVAGHIPGALTEGASLWELLPLGLDAVIGTGVLLVVRRSADIWWFWCVHFALDMVQF